MFDRSVMSLYACHLIKRWVIINILLGWVFVLWSKTVNHVQIGIVLVLHAKGNSIENFIKVHVRRIFIKWRVLQLLNSLPSWKNIDVPFYALQYASVCDWIDLIDFLWNCGVCIWLFFAGLALAWNSPQFSSSAVIFSKIICSPNLLLFTSFYKS